jgi:hypothetical protein
MRLPLAASVGAAGTTGTGVEGLDMVSPVYMHKIEWKIAFTAWANGPIFL